MTWIIAAALLAIIAGLTLGLLTQASSILLRDPTDADMNFAVGSVAALAAFFGLISLAVIIGLTGVSPSASAAGWSMTIGAGIGILVFCVRLVRYLRHVSPSHGAR
jgi:hypothetical protein